MTFWSCIHSSSSTCVLAVAVVVIVIIIITFSTSQNIATEPSMVSEVSEQTLQKK